MTPADIALARRAVAAPGWRWVPGLRVLPSNAGWTPAATVYATDGKAVCSVIDSGGNEWRVGGPLPDLADPATLGAVLGMVRARWGDPLLTCSPMPTTSTEPEAWAVYTFHAYHDDTRGVGRTEAEALIAALEAPHA